MTRKLPARIAVLIIFSVHLIALFSSFLLRIPTLRKTAIFRMLRRLGFTLSMPEGGFICARLYMRGFPGPGFGYHEDLRHIFPVEFFVPSRQTGADVPFACPWRLFGVREPGVIFLLGADEYILAEVTLSFLGLGIGEPVPSWGNMLSQARE